MSNVVSRTSLAALLVMAFAPAGADDGFRCGSRIITVGMTQAEVLEHCGAPASKSEEELPVRSGPQVVGRTQSSKWTYTSYGATHVLVFDQDRLVAIQ